jgi:hypothetical protein
MNENCVLFTRQEYVDTVVDVVRSHRDRGGVGRRVVLAKGRGRFTRNVVVQGKGDGCYSKRTFSLTKVSNRGYW